jgi:hypothetical protein
VFLFALLLYVLSEHEDRLVEFRNELRSKHRAALDLISASGGFWVTALGQRLRIKDMTDTHIANAIEYCRLAGEQGSEEAKLLRAERRWRRYNVRMEGQKVTPAQANVVIHGGDKVFDDQPIPPKPPEEQIEWSEVDRVLNGLIERLGLSSAKTDLWKLKHLLARGRKVR